MKNFNWKSVIFGFTLVSMIPLGGIAKASDASPEISVTIDSRPVYFDVAPQNIDGHVFVPLRAIFESMGAKVGWDEATQTVTGAKGDTTVQLSLNNTDALVNGKHVTLDSAATKIGERTLVPARFIAESLGAEVKWSSADQKVIISTGAEAADSLYYFIYNSQSVTDDDLAAIKLYINKFNGSSNLLIDASKYSSVSEIYDALKADHAKRGGSVAGVQIFGFEKDVPAFRYKHKINFVDPKGTYTHIEEMKEEFVSDFFFSTFKNDSEYFDDKLSVYHIFDENTPVSLVPEWPVSRLLLGKGEIAAYISRYYAYREQIDGKSVPLVSFSSPTFMRPWKLNQDDDFGFFMQQLKENFGILKNTEYHSYSNKQGVIVSNPAAKEMSIENLAKENEAGIMDFVFDGHGGPDGVLQTVTLEGAKGQADQKQNPFLTSGNINSVLNSNFYTALFWSCETVESLNDNNFIHKAMANGKMINPIVATQPLANNGKANYHEDSVDDWEGRQLTLEDLKKNNPNYFAYQYFSNLDQGKTRLESFTEAESAYAQELLKHQDTSKDERWGANFECGFMNILALHYVGLADYK